MSQFDLVAGDGASLLRIALKDSTTNAPVDLTGKTVSLRFVINGGATVQRTMTARDQGLYPGQADYTFLTTDLNKAGDLTGEVRLQAGLADQLTTIDQFHLSVKAPLPV